MGSDFISDYSFGKIVINGKSYSDDIILLHRQVVPSWWRDKGHYLSKDDLERVIEFKPDLLIVGKGHSGRMSIAKGLAEKLPFEIEAYNTKKAVEIYNQKIKKSEKIAGAFHLTC